MPPIFQRDSFATLAIGKAGAANAALAVVSVLGLQDAKIKSKLIQFRATQAEKVCHSTLLELV